MKKDQVEDIIHVLYIGEDSKFFNSLKKETLREYSELSFSFKSISFTSAYQAKNAFVSINNNPVDILYIDLTSSKEQGLYLAKLVSKNNEFQRISLVGLVSEQDQASSVVIRRALNSGMKIIHFKSIELFELIYDPISLLDVEKAHSRDLIVGKEIGEVEILQPLRVSFIEDNHFRIETNSYLNEGDIIEVDNHPLIDIMPSKKLYVDKFAGRDLYYNRRFSYDLEFIYLDNDFFSCSNKSWLIYKKLKDNPDDLSEIEEEMKDQVLLDMEERKKAFTPIKDKIEKWIEVHSPKNEPKALKIMVIDHTLDIFSQIDGRLEDFKYSLNFQTKIILDAYQIKRSTPHLIIFNFDEVENNHNELEAVFKKIKSLDNYHPAIVLCNYPFDEEALKEKVAYDNLLVHEGDVNIDEISNMAEILNEKRKLTSNHKRVYPKSRDLHSFIAMKRQVRIVSASEIIVYFKSLTEIPMWTVFEMKSPVNMLLTVVPFKENEQRPEGDHIYRALVHGVTENERAKLRRLINKSMKPLA